MMNAFRTRQIDPAKHFTPHDPFGQFVGADQLDRVAEARGKDDKIGGLKAELAAKKADA